MIGGYPESFAVHWQIAEILLDIKMQSMVYGMVLMKHVLFSRTLFFLSTLFCLRPRESQASCRGILLDMQNNENMFTLCHDHNPFLGIPENTGY